MAGFVIICFVKFFCLFCFLFLFVCSPSQSPTVRNRNVGIIARARDCMGPGEMSVITEKCPYYGGEMSVTTEKCLYYGGGYLMTREVRVFIILNQ